MIDYINSMSHRVDNYKIAFQANATQGILIDWLMTVRT